MHKFTVALLALAFGACASVQLPIAGPAAAVTLPNAKDRVATFQYLGTGGWLIRRGDDVVLTSPFFTNPKAVRLLIGWLHPNRRLIEERLRPLAADLDDVDVVVAGHAHYDHIMDLPVVFEHLPAGVPLFGGISVCHTLHSALHGRPCTVMSAPGTRDAAGTPYQAGTGIIVRPYRSSHAPQLLHRNIMTGVYDETGLDAVPTYAFRWREGEPLAYLIDFMDGSEVALRVYYQDAAAEAPFGLPDDVTLASHGIDVAILCVASYQQIKTHPDALLALHPKHLLLGHWENFFAPVSARAARVPLTNVGGFLLRIGGRVTYTLPDRGTRISITY
jgi:hypothetical protein